MNMNAGQRLIFKYFALLGLSLGFLWVLDFMGGLHGSNSFCYDLCFRLRGERAVDPRLLIVEIDEQTLEKLGRWPISRKYYAEFLDKVRDADAVGIDLIFSEPSPQDEILNSAVENHGRVVLPVYFDHRIHLLEQAPGLSPAATGHVHLDQDIDGKVRKVFHVILAGEDEIPSFSQAIHQVQHGSKAGRIYAPGSDTPDQFNRLRQLDPMTINYYGPERTVPHISLAEILSRKWPADFFTGKIILLGVTAPGIEDRVQTPFNSNRKMMPGVEVQAQILANLLEGNSIRTAPPPLEWILWVILGAGSLFFFIRLPVFTNALITVAMPAIISIAVLSMFALLDFWLPPAGFLITAMLGGCLGFLYHHDIQDKSIRQAEKNWREAFDAISDSIVLCDEKGTFVRQNKSAALLLDDTLRQAIHGYLADIHGESFSVAEIHKEDENRHILLTFHARFDEKNSRCGSVVVARDVTAQREAEETQRILEEQFYQVQKMESIGRLAGGIAHDFNNILTAILGYSELALLKGGVDKETRDYLKYVTEAGHKGEGLVRQLLAFSRKERREKKIIQLKSLIENLVIMLKRVIGEDVTLELDLDEVHYIEADPGQMEQILMNLVVNARDAMPDGGTITIKTGEQRIDGKQSAAFGGIKPGPYVLLSLIDNGAGIPDECLARIFEPFYSTKGEGGTGLGLSIIWNIVQQHNGHVTVQQLPEGGTRFDILIPVSLKEPESTNDSRQQILPRGNEKILLVEDQPEIRMLVSEILSPLGYSVETFSDAITAIKKVVDERYAFDLLVTDVVLPGMNGVELVKRLRKIFPEMNFLYISGYPDDVIAEWGILKPEIPFLPKPLTPAKLAHAVRRVLDGTFAGKDTPPL